MENKIEIGEYIRTQEGLIGKVKRIELDEIDKSLKWYVFDKKRYDMNIIDEIYINKPYIKSHSFNILDLIEENDIIKVKNEDEEELFISLDSKSFFDKMIRELIQGDRCNLLSIITKEQIKLIEYEI